MHIDFAPPSNGIYNNAGSCRQLANYLEHEDLDRMKKGFYTEGFFNLAEDNIYKSKIIKDIDSNIGQLLKTDAKFYAIHVSPSEKELRTMGNTEQEQAESMKQYIRKVFISEYAKNFNKELSALDIKFYGKIHFDRSRSNNELNMHCHLIISRKDQANKKKLSPLTNHKNTKNGVIKGGFNRVNLFQQVEQGFDRLFGYNRQELESFDYRNTMKNGSISEQLRQQEQELQSNDRKIGINQKNLLLTNLETLEARNQTLNTDTYITTNQKINNSDKQSSHQANSQLLNSSISFFSTKSDLLSSSSISEKEKAKHKKRRKYKRR